MRENEAMMLNTQMANESLKSVILRSASMWSCLTAGGMLARASALRCLSVNFFLSSLIPQNIPTDSADKPTITSPVICNI